MWISKGAAVIRGRRLFETRRLLEGIRQYRFQVSSWKKCVGSRDIPLQA